MGQHAPLTPRFGVNVAFNWMLHRDTHTQACILLSLSYPVQVAAAWFGHPIRRRLSVGVPPMQSICREVLKLLEILSE